MKISSKNLPLYEDIKIDKNKFPEKTNPYEKVKKSFKEYLS